MYWDDLYRILNRIISATMRRFPLADPQLLETYLMELLRKCDSYEEAISTLEVDAYYEGFYPVDEEAIAYALGLAQRFGLFEG